MDWAVVVATLAGPIFAVQAQKYLERISAKRQRKEWVFYTLISNRAARLSPDFVRALNTIDIAFRGGEPKNRSAHETKVINAWRDYHHLLSHGLDPKPTDADVKAWSDRVDDRIIDLLESMATDLGFSFDRENLRSGGYYTKGAADQEQQLAIIRESMVQMTRGQAAIPVVIVPAKQVNPTH